MFSKTIHNKLFSELLILRKSNSAKNSERRQGAVVIIFNYQVSIIQVFFMADVLQTLQGCWAGFWSMWTLASEGVPRPFLF